MSEILPFNLPFEEAIEYFKSKGIALSPEGWRQLWQQAHARAFTVAGVTDMEVLVDIKAAMQSALDTGTTLRDFKRDLAPALERRGWLAPQGQPAWTTGPDGTEIKRLTAWRLDTIFQTNLQVAYSVGHYTQMVEVAGARPYWQYHAIVDQCTRPEHAAMDGLIYHWQHPIWDVWYPPNGFNCRCYVSSLSAEDVEDRDLVVQTRGVHEQPDEGWRYNVGAAGLAAWQPDLSGYPRALLDQYQRGR